MLDFPNTPAVGDKYPASAVPGLPTYTWDGEKWTTVGAQISNASPATALPLMDGVAAVGVSTKYGREDHVHPSDTSRASVTYVDTQDNALNANKVAKAGDTMTGPLNVPNLAAADNSTKVPNTAFLAANAHRVDIAQVFTEPQMALARSNIYAAPFDAMAFSGMQLNGGGDVSQEFGAANNPLTNNVGMYVADGWNCAYKNAAASVVAGQIAAGTFLTPLPGYGYAVRMVAGTALSALANGDVAYMRQVIEGSRMARLAWGTASAQPLSYAMQLYASAAGVAFLRVANNGGTRNFHKEITVAAGWNWVTGTIPGDTAGVWGVSPVVGGLYLDLVVAGKDAAPAAPNVWGATAANQTTNSTNLLATNSNQITVTGFLILPGIELPSAARAPFIMRSATEELRLCQRQFYPFTGGAVGFANGTTIIQIATTHPVPMRTAPTLTANPAALATFDHAGGSNINPSSMAIAAFVVNEKAMEFRFLNYSGLVSGEALIIQAAGSILVKCDARL